MKVILAGEELRLHSTFIRIKKIEKECGVESFFLLGLRLKNGNISFTDVVNIYWLLQDDTAYSQEVIFQKILTDGLAYHAKEVGAIMALMLGGTGEDGKKEIVEG